MFIPRMFVKNGIEQWAGSIAHEVRLKWAGWRPKDEPPTPAPGNAAPEGSSGASRKKPTPAE